VQASRLLVAGDEYYATLAAVRGLRAAGYEPWLAMTTDQSLAARSRTIGGARRAPHPSLGADTFVAAMRTAAQELSAAAILPGTEASLAALAGRDVGAINGAPGPELVARATDKDGLATLAADAGLVSPESFRFVAPAQDVPDVPLPAIVKPARSTVTEAGRTVDLPATRCATSREELLQAVAELPPGEYLLQGFIDGPLCALAGVAWQGRVLCLSQQVAARIHPPGAGASAFARTVPLDAELARAARRLISGLGWSGLWQLQFIAAAAGPRLIDFNPRFYGSLALAIGAGLNLPATWADLLLGREPRIGTYRPGVSYRAEVRDARAFAAAVRRRDARAALEVLRPRRHTVHAVFSVRDPRPILGVASRLRAGER
jgi:predicted ATP-grasp superfamily ATP-dependent carboligase